MRLMEVMWSKEVAGMAPRFRRGGEAIINIKLPLGTVGIGDSAGELIFHFYCDLVVEI